MSEKDKSVEPEKTETNNGSVTDKAWEDTDKNSTELISVKVEDVIEDEDEDSTTTTER